MFVDLNRLKENEFWFHLVFQVLISSRHLLKYCLPYNQSIQWGQPSNVALRSNKIRRAQLPELPTNIKSLVTFNKADSVRFDLKPDWKVSDDTISLQMWSQLFSPELRCCFLKTACTNIYLQVVGTVPFIIQMFLMYTLGPVITGVSFRKQDGIQGFYTFLNVKFTDFLKPLPGPIISNLRTQQSLAWDTDQG